MQNHQRGDEAGIELDRPQRRTDAAVATITVSAASLFVCAAFLSVGSTFAFPYLLMGTILNIGVLGGCVIWLLTLNHNTVSTGHGPFLKR